MKEPRYLRNGILKDEEQELLKSKKVAVIGCGGLGGYVIEMLARLGIGHLVICDGDCFDETNLNRQLLSTEENLGAPKALEATKRVVEINSSIEVTVRNEKLHSKNGRSIISGCDLVIDALDSPKDKVLLEKLCEKQKIPMIHGGISGWFGEMCVILPGDQTLARFFEGQEGLVEPVEPYGNPAFTPALVAALQVSEATKVLLDKGAVLSRQMTLIDLYCNEMELIEV